MPIIPKFISRSKLFEKIMSGAGYMKSQNIASAIQNIIDGGGGGDDKGKFKDWEQAYSREAWVYACVYVIANAIAGIPFKFYKKTNSKTSGKKEEVESHAIIELFNQPNTYDHNSTWYNLIEYTVAALELTGNSYWLHDKVVSGKPTVLHYLMSSHMTVKPAAAEQAPAYIGGYIFNQGQPGEKNYNPDEISHFKYMSMLSYLYGQSSIAAGEKSIETMHEAMDTNYNIFKNGANLDGAFETDNELTKVAYERLRAEVNNRYVGTEKAHKNLILEAGLKYKPLTAGMRELEYIEGLKINREDICAVFGVPPCMVGILDKATYSNYEQAVDIFWKQTILPKLQRIKPIINNSIVKKYDASIYFDFDLSMIGAFQDDYAMLSEIATKFFNMGIPPKQIIEKLNLPFTEYEGWDNSYLPFSLSAVGEEVEEPTPEPEEPEPAPEPDKAKSLSSETKDAIWKAFDKQSAAIENKYKKLIDIFFSELEKIIIRKLEARKGLYDKDIFKVNSDSFIFDEKVVTKKWQEKIIEIHKFTVKTRGNYELENLGLEPKFDLDNPRVKAYLEKYSMTQAKEVIGTLREDVKDSLAEGFGEGESIPDLSKRVRDIFEPYKDEKYKADRIARTEVISASNAGATEAYRQSGVVEKKQWLSTRDDRTRDGHADADGQTVALDAEFDVSGESLAFPGDPSGSPENVIQCRCTIVPVVEK